MCVRVCVSDHFTFTHAFFALSLILFSSYYCFYSSRNTRLFLLRILERRNSRADVAAASVDSADVPVAVDVRNHVFALL